MKDLYILGSGGHAIEVYFLAKRIGIWNIKGMLDIEDKDPVVIGSDKVPVINESFIDNLLPEKTCLAIGIAGSNKIIKKMIDQFSGKFEFPNLIDPSVIIDLSFVKLGKGNILTANNTFTADIKIGSFNVFNIGGVFHHEVVIGDGNIFAPSTNICGGVKIGNFNYFGVKCTILQYLNVGNSNLIGASSLVTKTIGDSKSLMGMPAEYLENKK